MILSLSQHHCVGQGSPAGSNVNRATTGEVQSWKIIKPAVAAPCPSRQRAVDECGPEEAEYQRWQDISTFKGPTDDNHHLP